MRFSRFSRTREGDVQAPAELCVFLIRGICTLRLLEVSLDAEKQVFAFPGTDDAHELLELAALQREIDVAESLAHDLMKRCAFLEIGERFEKPAR